MSEDLVYGRQPVREALRGRRAVREVLATAKAREALAWLDDAPCPVRIADTGKIGNLARSTDHQGLVARVDPYPYADPDELLEGPAPLIVALDGVTDPHNLGAILRSAVALGADAVITLKDRAAPVTPVVVRASAGATEHARVVRVVNLARTLASLRDERG
ncbi:MAG: TrmH family RNA methyltransferase, partial [Actinomycetota bacterium]